jgi:hypothetical protein
MGSITSMAGVSPLAVGMPIDVLYLCNCITTLEKAYYLLDIGFVGNPFFCQDMYVSKKTVICSLRCILEKDMPGPR